MRLLTVLFLAVTMLGVPNLTAATYAILGFDAGTSVTHDVMWDLSGEIGDRISRETGDSILSQENTHRVLREKKLFSSAYASAMDYARAVGEATDSDYVLFGAVRAAGGGHRLNAYLFDVASGTVTKRGTTVIEASPQAFAEQAAEKCVESLGLASARSGQTPSALASTTAFSGSASGGGWKLPGPVESLYSKFVRDHLSLGLRVSHFSFTDPSERTYDQNGNLAGGFTFGISTYDLEEQQTYTPYPYLLYAFTPYIALQVGWERIEGRAWTLDFADPHYDGDAIFRGPSFTLLGRYDNRTRFTPFAGVGIALFDGELDEEEDWTAGGFRKMTASDTKGYLFTLGSSISTEGTSFSICDRVEIDISASYMLLESDARYWLAPESRDRAHWTWPADNILFQIGVRYGL